MDANSIVRRINQWAARGATHLPAPLNDPRVRLRLQAGVAAALAAGLLVYLLLFTGLLAPLNRLATDLLYHPATPNPDIAVIAIDKKTLDELGAYPYPRAVYAALLDRLQNTPPRVVAFDLLFAQPSSDDFLFAQAMRQQGAVYLTTTGVQAAAFPQEPNQPPTFDIVILPDTELRQAAAGIGHRMIFPDEDGIVRRIPTAIQANQLLYPALGLAAAANILGDKEVEFDLAAHTVRVGSVQIPIDDSGNALLNFTSPTTGIPNYSFVDVFRGVVPPETFANKVIFIGGTGSIETEDYTIPLQLGTEHTHNVNLQADLASMLLNNPPQTLATQGALAQLVLTFGLALLAGLALPHLRPLYAAAVTLVLLMALLLFAFEAFNRGTIIEWLYPAIALALTFVGITLFRYLSEERRRQFLTLLFRRYVPAESVGRVVDAIDRGELPLTGTRRTVTVLYADLRGFGAHAEEQSAEDVLRIVNQYIELVLHAIQSEGGTISKPMGDSLVAIWNAPLDQPDHTARGLRAAIRIQRNVAPYQEQSEGENLSVGIGLATGWAVLGNISALGKTEYTLVGDTVNVAARISAFANNNQILADTVTAENVPAGIAVRALTPVRVRGRKEPLAVWEVRDDAPPAPNHQSGR